MEHKNKQTDEIAALSQKEGTQKSSESAGRLNIDDINRRIINFQSSLSSNDCNILVDLFSQFE